MKSSFMQKLLILLLPLFLLIIPAARAATNFSYDAAGNLTGASSTPSVLTTLVLSGNPNLTYNGTPLTFDLSTLLTGADQFGYHFDLSNLVITWTVNSGPATVSGSILTINNYGQIEVTASINNITSNTLSFTIAQAPPVFSGLNLSGSPSPPLVYNNTPVNYNLANLTLAGADQFGNPYSITGQSVTWAVYSGPATVSGSTLTITNFGQVGVTASIGTVTSNTLTLTVYQALAPPSNFSQTGAASSQISVSWSSETGASSYNLYENSAYLTNVTGTVYTYTGLSAGSSYALAVCALDSSGNPGNQASVTGYTLTATPTVSVSSVTGSSIQVSWNLLYGASYYNSYIWNGSSWVINNSHIKTTSYTFSGLTSGTSYTLGIAGVNAAGAQGAVGQISQTTNGSQTYSTPGTSNFTVPAGVTRFIVFVCGGGGGGAGGYSGTSGGYGGGGGPGGCAIAQVAVTPGQQYTITIGSGGAGGPASGLQPGNASPGSSGTSSSFSGNGVNIVGGPGGGGSVCGSGMGTGQGGGNGGGNGAYCADSMPGIAGGSTGPSNMGYGANSMFGTGGALGCPGGNGGIGAGGGGGSVSGHNYPGGNGGNGQVVAWWYYSQQTLGSQSFTSNGTFTIPVNVSEVIAFVCGGGGGGAGGYSGTSGGRGGGGGPGGCAIAQVAVTPGQQYTITIGSGGAGGPASGLQPGNASPGSSGTSSSFSGNGVNIVGGPGGGGSVCGSGMGTGQGGGNGGGNGAYCADSMPGIAGGSTGPSNMGYGANSMFGTGGALGCPGGNGGIGAGGGGGSVSGHNYPGGNGGNGQVVAWW